MLQHPLDQWWNTADKNKGNQMKEFIFLKPHSAIFGALEPSCKCNDRA